MGRRGGPVAFVLSGGGSLGAAQVRVLRALIRSGDAVVFADRAGVIRLWNRGADDIFGYSGTEAIGRTLDLIIPKKLQERHWEGYHR